MATHGWLEYFVLSRSLPLKHLPSSQSDIAMYDSRSKPPNVRKVWPARGKESSGVPWEFGVVLDFQASLRELIHSFRTHLATTVGFFRFFAAPFLISDGPPDFLQGFGVLQYPRVATMLSYAADGFFLLFLFIFAGVSHACLLSRACHLWAAILYPTLLADICYISLYFGSTRYVFSRLFVVVVFLLFSSSLVSILFPLHG